MTERRYTPEDYCEAVPIMQQMARLMYFNRDGFHPEATDRRALWNERGMACDKVVAMLRQAAEDAEAEPQMRLYCWRCDTKHDPKYDCPSNAERDR